MSSQDPGTPDSNQRKLPTSPRPWLIVGGIIVAVTAGSVAVTSLANNGDDGQLVSAAETVSATPIPDSSLITDGTPSSSSASASTSADSANATPDATGNVLNQGTSSHTTGTNSSNQSSPTSSSSSHSSSKPSTNSTTSAPSTGSSKAPTTKPTTGLQLKVNRTTGLNPTGTTLTVTGSGYDMSKGIYVAFCVRPPAGQLPTPCGGGADTDGSSHSSVWISSNPPSYGKALAKPYGKGGTFSVTLNVQAMIGSTDCRKVACVVVTRADHTRSSDRSLDVFVPVSFKAS